MKEIWKPIPEYKRLYEISSMGRVRKAQASRGGYEKGYVLKGVTEKRFGYRYVDLYKNSQAKRCFIHRLVLLVFIGPCPKKMEARHLNDIKTDNRLKNLKWGTRKQNIADAFRNGISMCGKGIKRSKETCEQCRQSRLRYLAEHAK